MKYTAKPLLSAHPREWANWPLNRGFPKYSVKYGKDGSMACIGRILVYWCIPCDYLFEGDSFSCAWLQAKLITKEFDVRYGGHSKAY